MPRTLRARLLVWYSAVLAVVLSTFASLAVWSIWRSSVADLDARLRPIAVQLGGAVQADDSGGFEVNLAETAFAAFGEADDAPYYAIWTADGALIDRSDPFIDPAFPGTPGARMSGGRREVIVASDSGALVLVGQSPAEARANLRSAAAALGVGGAAALLLAALGGWLLLGRALAPIGGIARTAAAMSESNLGLRIEISSDDELGRVAGALNRAFDRIQDAFERQARFTADASHELRTPLASQIAELEWALARSRTATEYEGSLRVCMRAAQRMRGVVEGLLTLARADAGAVPLQRGPVDLAQLAGEVIDATRTAAADRGIVVRCDGMSALTHGDPDRLRELIGNLVGNAVQYGAPGGEVICSTTAVDGRAILEVRDTGPGIDADDLPHVFERFYRANKARSRVSGGAGLGLAISKWIAESHGGRIVCESAIGRGTCFTVDLPQSADVFDVSSLALPREL